MSSKCQIVGRKTIDGLYDKKITPDFCEYNSRLDNMVYKNKCRVLEKRHVNINIL